MRGCGSGNSGSGVASDAGSADGGIAERVEGLRSGRGRSGNELTAGKTEKVRSLERTFSFEADFLPYLGALFQPGHDTFSERERAMAKTARRIANPAVSSVGRIRRSPLNCR